MDETYQILLGLRERYEAHHKLRYTDEALDAAAKFSSQYISDRFLPDKVRAACFSWCPGSCNSVISRVASTPKRLGVVEAALVCATVTLGEIVFGSKGNRMGTCNHLCTYAALSGMTTGECRAAVSFHRLWCQASLC